MITKITILYDRKNIYIGHQKLKLLGNGPTMHIKVTLPLKCNPILHVDRQTKRNIKVQSHNAPCKL